MVDYTPLISVGPNCQNIAATLLFAKLTNKICDANFKNISQTNSESIS